MSKKISLTRGLFTTVDDTDFEWLNQWKWYAMNNKSTFYAVRNAGWPIQKRIWMHRLIMNTPNELEVDHKDGNGLNNTRENLRNCTHAQNGKNNKERINNSSGSKGIHWRNGKWYARIMVDSKSIHLGCFSNKDEATHAYSEAVKKYHGEYTRINNAGGNTKK